MMASDDPMVDRNSRSVVSRLDGGMKSFAIIATDLFCRSTVSGYSS